MKENALFYKQILADDQCIDCEEFCLFMEKENAKGNPAKRLKEAFEFYDKDKNGYIERHELKGITAKQIYAHEVSLPAVLSK